MADFVNLLKTVILGVSRRRKDLILKKPLQLLFLLLLLQFPINIKFGKTTINSRPFGPADGGNPHLITSVTTVSSLVTGEQLSVPFSVQNQLSQAHQGNRVNDKFFYTTFLDENNLYGQFELFLSQANYFDNIDISSVAKGTPTSMLFKNNKSANVQTKFVDEAISELLNIGCVIGTTFQQFVVNLCVAVQGSGKKRLILDLSDLNVFN
ncbi:unnamed protein product [Mytilus coruscus]|uniref:Uncharacterized protein n=1 Tax=Mytilus coruscus TaxID=42192 RepID=A0A6J8B5H4_MYTCO|nr:unnamed protein product [Mytilus coruscus]